MSDQEPESQTSSIDHSLQNLEEFKRSNLNKEDIQMKIEDEISVDFEIVSNDQQIEPQNRKLKNKFELFVDNFFRKLIPQSEGYFINLDQISQEYDLSMGRIYLTMNILKGLSIVQREGKLQYRWNGIQKMYRALHQIRESEYWKNYLSKAKSQKIKNIKELTEAFIYIILTQKNIESIKSIYLLLFPNQKQQRKQKYYLQSQYQKLYCIANVFLNIGIIQKNGSALEFSQTHALSLLFQQNK